MRLILPLVLLSLTLIGVAMFLQWSEQAKRDSLAAGWAHSLIWHALGLAQQPSFDNTQLRRDHDQGHSWRVAGQLRMDSKLIGDGPVSYVASLGRVCEDDSSRDCWMLRDLTVGELALMRNGTLNSLALPAYGAAVKSEAVQDAHGFGPLKRRFLSTESVAPFPSARILAERSDGERAIEGNPNEDARARVVSGGSVARPPLPRTRPSTF